MSQAETPERPYCIGHYTVGGRHELLPASWAELGRAEEAFAEILAPFDFAPGRLAIFVADVEETVQAGPLEAACIGLGLVTTSAINEVFDASRVEAMMRRFDVAAVFGVSAATLQGLAERGHDLAQVFAGAVVWARPDAYARLRGLAGVEVRRWIDLGPALAIGCVHDGVHLDEREWRPEVADGHIVLSSRLPRALTFSGLDTQVEGGLETRPCACGNPGRRISLEP